MDHMPTAPYAASFTLERIHEVQVLRLRSDDGTNRLTRACVLAMTAELRKQLQEPEPLIITGNRKFFSAGAELKEIAALTTRSAYEFSKIGLALMNLIEGFPAPVYAAVSGYCVGGGLDLALACHQRIASPNAVFGHRGTALGLITGWGGTQRLPRLIGRAQALRMFVAAETIYAQQALGRGLVDAVVVDPVQEAASRIRDTNPTEPQKGRPG